MPQGKSTKHAKNKNLKISHVHEKKICLHKVLVKRSTDHMDTSNDLTDSSRGTCRV